MAIRSYAAAVNDSAGLVHSSTVTMRSSAVSCWFRINKLPDGITDIQYAFNLYGNSNSAWYGVNMRPDAQGLSFSNINGSSIRHNYVIPLSGDPLSNWFWAGYSAGTNYFNAVLKYRNSVSMYTFNQINTDAAWLNNARINLSNWNSNSPDPGNANIYNVKVFNSTLTHSELLRESVSYKPVHSSNYAWWPLENSEDLYDHSGNGNNLTVVGKISTEQNPVNYHKYSPIHKQQALPQYSRDVYLATRGRR